MGRKHLGWVERRVGNEIERREWGMTGKERGEWGMRGKERVEWGMRERQREWGMIREREWSGE